MCLVQGLLNSQLPLGKFTTIKSILETSILTNMIEKASVESDQRGLFDEARVR
jgi:hypothetical protein